MKNWVVENDGNGGTLAGFTCEQEIQRIGY